MESASKQHVRHAMCGVPLVLDEEAKDKQIIWAREVIAIDDFQITP